MKTLLITGFDPFGGATVNPSWQAVKRLPDTIGEYVLCKLEIPTVFGRAAETVLAAAEKCQPDVILCIGQAAKRSAVTPERVAVNLQDARIPDNDGRQPMQELCVADGPVAYLATVPYRQMAQAMESIGIEAKVSNSAGTFVCNDTLYRLLHHFEGTPTRVGFIHIPSLPEQGQPNLPLEDSVRALQAAIGVL